MKKGAKSAVLSWFCLLFTALGIYLYANSHFSFTPNFVSDRTQIMDLNQNLFFTITDEEQTPLPWLRPYSSSWQFKQEGPVNAGVNTHTWVKTHFRMTIDAPSEWILKIDWPALKQVDWYLLDEDQALVAQGRLGQQSTMQDALFHDRYAVPLTVTSGQAYDLYLRASGTEKVIVPIFLYQPDAYHTQVRTYTLFTGLFYGALLAMLFYNLSLYIFIRDTNYAIYCGYVVGITFYTLATSGVGSAFIWTNFTWLNDHSYRLTASLAFLLAAIFIRTFLGLPAQGGVLAGLGNLAVGSWCAALLLLPVLPNDWHIMLVDQLGYSSCIIGFGITCYRWYQGDPSGKYMTIAWSLLIISTFVLMLGLTDQIPYSINLYHLQNMGFLIEVLLLSMALAERINRARKERSEAQAQSLYYEMKSLRAREREVKAQQRAVAIERDAKEQLERKVDEQTSELKLAMYSLSQANEELERMSQTDGLTGLSNRRYFDKKFAEELELAIFSKEPLAIFMVDIDYFKKVNDQYGHQTGDACLRIVSSHLQNYVTETQNLCARYGGEEFCLVLVGLQPQEALQLAQTIREDIAGTTIVYQDNSIHVTVSIGLHVVTPNEHSQGDYLIRVADEALYQAKANGRNCVEIRY